MICSCKAEIGRVKMGSGDFGPCLLHLFMPRAVRKGAQCTRLQFVTGVTVVVQRASPMRLTAARERKPPLFFVHPMGGSCLVYLNLLSLLPNVCHVYALNDPSIELDDAGRQASRFPSFAEMVHRYEEVCGGMFCCPFQFFLSFVQRVHILLSCLRLFGVSRLFPALIAGAFRISFASPATSPSRFAGTASAAPLRRLSLSACVRVVALSTAC
jgi:hypothetical protein